MAGLHRGVHLVGGVVRVRRDQVGQPVGERFSMVMLVVMLFVMAVVMVMVMVMVLVLVIAAHGDILSRGGGDPNRGQRWTRSAPISSIPRTPASIITCRRSSVRSARQLRHDGFAAAGQGPQHRTAEEHRVRTESQRGEYVFRAADPAVDVDLGVTTDRGDDLGQHGRGGEGQVELTAAVVGDCYGGRTGEPAMRASSPRSTPLTTTGRPVTLAHPSDRVRGQVVGFVQRIVR